MPLSQIAKQTLLLGTTEGPSDGNALGSPEGNSDGCGVRVVTTMVLADTS